MEERISTASDDTCSDDFSRHRSSLSNYEPVYRPRPFPSRKLSIQETSSPRVSEQRISGTYVVQMPKDQIFSRPPPENATIIAERLRSPPEKKDRTSCKRFLCIFLTLLAVAVIIGIVVAVLHTLYSPKVPSFSILQVHAKNSPSSGHKRAHWSFKIELKVKNENKRMGMSYGSKSDATLCYTEQNIGSGNFPIMKQDADGSNNVELNLPGSRDGLPHNVQTSIKDKHGKKDVSLTLKMKLPLKMRVGSLKLRDKVSDVVCHLKVSSLEASGDNVISQQCQSKFE